MHRSLCCPQSLCSVWGKEAEPHGWPSLALPLHRHPGQGEGRASSLVLIQLLHRAVPFQNVVVETLCPALHSRDLIPCPSVVRTCSSLSLSPKKTLLMAWVMLPFSIFSSQWRLELVAKTRLARDLSWSLALHKEHIP